MLTGLVVALRSLALWCAGHKAVALENLALRQQLAIYKRTAKRPPLRSRDRLFWMLLLKVWRRWRTALIVSVANSTSSALTLEGARERRLNQRRFASLIRTAPAGVTSRRDRRVI